MMNFLGATSNYLKVHGKTSSIKFQNFGKISGSLFLFWKDDTIFLLGPDESRDSLVDNTFDPSGPFEKKFYKRWKEDSEFRNQSFHNNDGKRLFLISRALWGAFYTASSSSLNSGGEVSLMDGQIHASVDGGLEIKSGYSNGSLSKQFPIAFELIELFPDGTYKPFR